MQRQAAGLTLNQQLADIEKNCRNHLLEDLPLDFLEVVTPIVVMLRANPNVQTLPENKYILAGATSLHWSVILEDPAMVSEILAADIVDVNVQCRSGRTAFHDAVRRGNMDIVKLMVDKHLESGTFDVNVVDITGFTALHSAIEHGDSESVLMVRELLRCKDVRMLEECGLGRTPLQIAYEKGYRVIQSVLMEKEVVRRYLEDLYKDRRVYVYAANAILVGAALIATVTFCSWFQPPLGFTSDYADVQHNIGLEVFWIFNNFSLYFAVATVVFGVRSVLSRDVYSIKRSVERLRKNVLVMAALLACCLHCVMIAFATAGCIVLMPILKQRWYMIAPTIIGGLVCLISLGYLYCSIFEHTSKRIKVTLGREYQWFMESTKHKGGHKPYYLE